MEKTFSMHITYNDGSNPFCMFNVEWDVIVKELKFQLKANKGLIKEVLFI